MARPIKENAAYFSHDADMRNNRKIKALRARFGMEGYAVWCMMLECLTDENGFMLTWDSLNIELISGDFGIDAERLSAIVSYMSAIGLVEIQSDTLRCPAHRLRMQFVIDERERKRQWKSLKREVRDGENQESDDENAQIKGKEIKGKEIKGKEIKGKGVSDTPAPDENPLDEKNADGDDAATSDEYTRIHAIIVQWGKSDDWAALKKISSDAQFSGEVKPQVVRFITYHLGKDNYREKIIQNPLGFFLEQFPGWLHLPAANSQKKTKSAFDKSSITYPIGNPKTVSAIVKQRHPTIAHRITEGQTLRLASAPNEGAFCEWLESMAKRLYNGYDAPRTNGNAHEISTHGLSINSA